MFLFRGERGEKKRQNAPFSSKPRSFVVATLGSTLLSHSVFMGTNSRETKKCSGWCSSGIFFFFSWKDPVVGDSACVLFSSLFSPAVVPPAVRSYDAVQRRVGELRVDVGEAGKLALVDIGDNQLVGGGQHRLRAGEELVKVLRPFTALKEEGDLYKSHRGEISYLQKKRCCHHTFAIHKTF